MWFYPQRQLLELCALNNPESPETCVFTFCSHGRSVDIGESFRRSVKRPLVKDRRLGALSRMSPSPKTSILTTGAVLMSPNILWHRDRRT
ncbi:hypothetical protein BST61_g11441 [Cercospora zeina]